MKHTKIRLLSLSMAIVLLLSVLVFAADAAKESQRTVVVACSDFQHPDGDDAGAVTVTNILTNIKNDGYDADGFLCCGDYTYQYDAENQKECSENGLKKLSETVDSIMPNIKNKAFVKGNHDYSSVSGLSSSGANDTDTYGVFILHETEYMDVQEGPSRLRMINRTAGKLEAYLKEKADAGYRKPIFVISHVPLNYSLRTHKEASAGGAVYIFDVMDKYAKQGLNLYFLFGHDHSHGWDNYLGAASIYLEPGDTIMIANPEDRTAAPTERTLSFTYMNAGYTGYYSVDEGEYNGPYDMTLTMTVFSFTDDEMEITRYDEEGEHNLKACGYYNHRNGNQEQALGYYTPDTTVYPSKVTAFLNPFSDVTSAAWYYNAVEYSYTNNLFSGTASNRFSPTGSMTRSMLATVLYRFAGSPDTDGTNPFGDVPANSWYTDAVIWAAENKITNGTSADTFSPNGNVTREQIAVILYNYVKTFRSVSTAGDGLNAFPDKSAVSAWAAEAVCWAVEEGLISGVRQGDSILLVPGGNASRAEVAAIFMRFAKAFGK